ARERVAGAMGSARTGAASGLEAAAGRLDEMASRRETAGGPAARAAGAAHGLADGMESVASFIRSGDVQQLRAGFEERVRTQPVQTLLATLAVGFVVGRILR